MDAMILTVGIAFIALLALVIVIFWKEPSEKKQNTPASAPFVKNGFRGKTLRAGGDLLSKLLRDVMGLLETKKPAQPDLRNPTETDPTVPLKKKIAHYEAKIRELEANLKTLESEFAAAQLKEKELLREKSTTAFDSEQYEKFKKEYLDLKQELAKKEEILEEEITVRRQQTGEILQLRENNEALKKKALESDDTFRKSQTLVETLTQELKTIKQALQEKEKIVSEHSANKIEGEWVSREEFNKLEHELKEKEDLIQKMLSAKKET